MTAWGWIGWALAIFFGDLLAVAVIVAVFASRRLSDRQREHLEAMRRADYYRKEANLLAYLASDRYYENEGQR